MAEEPPQGGQEPDVQVTNTAPGAGITIEGNTIEPDWKAESRKHEKRSKESYAEAQALKVELDEIRAASQSEQEKAITQAVKEERKKNLQEYETERRSNRLQIAVANHARELADVDDVVLNLQKAGTNELFTAEGQIDTGALGTALEDLLGRKPHLRAGEAPVSSDVDQGKGAGPTGDSMNDWLRR